MPEVSNKLLEASHTFRKGETVDNGCMSGTIKGVGLHSVFIEVAGYGTVKVAKTDYRNGSLWDHIISAIKEKKVEKEQSALQARADECEAILTEEQKNRKFLMSYIGKLRASVRNSKNKMSSMLRDAGVKKGTEIEDSSKRAEYEELNNLAISDRQKERLADADFWCSIDKSRRTNDTLAGLDNQIALWDLV